MVVLEVTEGPEFGRREKLAHGKILHLGNAVPAEIVVSTDSEIAPVHCSFQSLGDACRVCDLTGEGKVQVNGQAVSQGIARENDLLKLGRTVFCVRIEDDNVEEVDDVTESRETATEFYARMDLTPVVEWPGNLDEVCRPLELYYALSESGQFEEALNLLAHWLPKEQAVKWSCSCIRKLRESTCESSELEAITLAESWCEQSTEDLRRKAELSAAEHAGNTSAGMLLRSVVYSGGSLAPAGFPLVPPADDLTGKAVALTLQLAVIETECPEAVAVYEEFLRLAESSFDLKDLESSLELHETDSSIADRQR